jgi:hypothetical protein
MALRLARMIGKTLVVFGLTSVGPAFAAGTNVPSDTSLGAEAATASHAVLASDTTPGRLQTYRAAALSAIAARGIADDRQADLAALNALTDSQVASMYPTGGYASALSAAEAALGFAQDAATLAEDRSAAALMILTSGRVLDPVGLARLHALLGL